MKEFAGNLKRLRKEYCLSQSELANKSCISIKTIQNYEQNRDGRAPTLHNLMILADIFNVTPYNLFYGGSKEMNTNSLYMDEIFSELTQLSEEAISEIHDSNATGTNLPKLSISDKVINKLEEKWNKEVLLPKRGYYRSYIEQTITRYAQERQFWKKKFNL